MNTVQDLIEKNLTYILIAMMAIFYTMEQFLPTQFKFDRRPRHQFQNLLFFVLQSLINLVYATGIVGIISWLNARHVGLLYLVDMPTWGKMLLAIPLFDVTNYWFHRAAHRIPLVWRFHRVHHSDNTMDASTNFRGHPIEGFIWFAASNVVAAGVFGLDLASLGLFIIVSTPFFFFEHSNIRFPVWLDKTLGKIITTPNLHKIHHDEDQHYTDSNYSDIFIIWDKFFGTYKFKPVDDIKFGLKEFQDDRQQDFWYLIKSPFFKKGSLESDRK